MKRIIAPTLLSLCCLTSLSAQELQPISTTQAHRFTTNERITATRASLPVAYFTNESDLQADFRCTSAGEASVIWSENFDDGADEWTLNNAESFGWELYQSTGDKAFSSIDPTDKMSLRIEGDYRVYNRGTASAISPKLSIPQNATISGYIGYSLNFSENCTLTLFASTDGESWTQLWTSTDDKGEKPWTWRKMELKLTEWGNKEVLFKFEYGNLNAYDNAGYMGDFIIDGLVLTAAEASEQVSVMTGETVSFADASTGNPTSWTWHFPGGIPETSNQKTCEVYYTQDGEYDVSLTVSDGQNTSTRTYEKFVKVTGTTPTAHIIPPATFRYADTRLPMVAPLVPVQFRDGSEGFPTSWEWTFSGTEPDNNESGISSEQHPVVDYDFMHKQAVILSASNMHGESTDMIEVSAEYDGLITNLQPNDPITTFDLGDGYGEFPGTNLLEITEYAEKFSKPSRPVLVYGARVYFTQATATELLDQITDVKVSLNKSENGLPGEQLEFASWRVFELELPSGGTLTGTDFEFSKPIAVNDEFFFVVSGIPVKNETCTVSFAMAKFRDNGNTAYFKQRGTWKSAAEYFPAGSNHTSYAIYPLIAHSVMKPLSETPVTVGKEKGKTSVELFSYMGYETPIECDADWCRVVSEPNGMTVDNIEIEYDQLPAGIESRTAQFTLTDGLSSVEIQLIQENNSGITAAVVQPLNVYPTVFSGTLNITVPEQTFRIEILNATGTLLRSIDTAGQTRLTVDGSEFPNGMVFVKAISPEGTSVIKAVKH